MADTVITNTPHPQTDNSAGWIVAVLILVAVVGGGIYAYRTGMLGNRSAPDTTNINVTIPNPIPGSGAEGGTQ